MVSKTLQTTTDSIKGNFNKYTPEKALCEYIWNGLDEDATEIKITTRLNTAESIDQIVVSNNGKEIIHSEVENTFEVYLDSKKKKLRKATTRGRLGRGRFSFFKFADKAQWLSWSNGLEFTLKIDTTALHKYDVSEPVVSTRTKTGTEVTFDRVSISYEYFNDKIIPYLKKEFSWLLFANPGLKILVNDIEIQVVEHKLEQKDEEYLGSDFSIKSVVWPEKPNSENSFIYFLNSKFEVVKRESSALNYKGFFGSGYVKSEWFDEFEDNDDALALTTDRNLCSDEYKFALKSAKDLMSDHHLTYKHKATDVLISTFEREGVFPVYDSDNHGMNEYRHQQLVDTIRVIYEAEPSLFSKTLNKTQKKIILRLLDKIIASNNLENLFSVLDGVVSLDSSEIDQLAAILKKTTLANITKTIANIKDRLDIIHLFKSLIYDHKKYALEVPHIQKAVDSNLWLFGEQYHLLTAEEDKFESALRKYLKFKDKEDVYQKGSIIHHHKNKEMDIFAAQKGKRVDDSGKEYYHNIVIELKRPSVKLSDKELNQIQEYKSVICSHDEFNDETTRWDFILVGNEFCTTSKADRLLDDIDSNKIHGEAGLVQKSRDGKVRVYAKTWKQIINEFELRYDHIEKTLKLQELALVGSNPTSTTNQILKLSNSKA